MYISAGDIVIARVRMKLCQSLNLLVVAYTNYMFVIFLSHVRMRSCVDRNIVVGIASVRLSIRINLSHFGIVPKWLNVYRI